MTMVARTFFIATMAVHMGSVSSVAKAQGMRFLTHGSEVKAAAGAGVTTASGPLATFYNPAALMSIQEIESYGELAVLDLRYSYKTEGFNAAKIRVTTPIVSVGLGARIGSRITFGGMLLPVPGGASKLTVKNVPSRQMSIEPGLIDVSVSNGKTFGYQAAAGAAFALSDAVDIGLGAAAFAGDQDLQIYDSETGQEILAANSSASSLSYSVGTRLRPANGLSFGVLYKSPTQYKVSGKFLNEGGEGFSRKSTTGDVFVGSAQLSMFGFSPFAEVSHSRFSKNRGSISPLAPPDEVQIESYDTTSFVLGSQYKIKPRHKITLAFGWYPTSAGAGSVANPENNLPEVAGIQFGDMDALSRKVYAGGYQLNIKKISLNFSGAFHDGVREVPDYSRGFGTYKIQIATGSLSMKWRF